MALGKRIALASLVVVASHVVGFALAFVMPHFKMQWDNTGARLSYTTELLIRASDFMMTWWHVILPLILVMAVLSVVIPMLRRRPTSPG